MTWRRSAVPAALAFLTAILSISGTARGGDLNLEASLSSGSANNLFSESSTHYSNYSAASVGVDYYPVSFARINLVGEYTYYRHFSQLSNLVYGGGLTLIPTSDSSRFSAFITGNIRKREYRDSEQDTISINASEFTGTEYDALVSVGYDVKESVQIRAGVSLTSIGNGIDGVLDRRSYGAFAGVNATLMERYSLDLEIGYARSRYQYIDPIKTFPSPVGPQPRGAITPGEQYDILLEDDLRSVYVSPRLSTSIGRKTGIGLTYSHRKFVEYDQDAVIYGYSTGYLSPWMRTYQGESVLLNLKTFLIPRMIVTVTAGYWKREHLGTVENEIITNPLGQDVATINMAFAQKRTDFRNRLSVRLQLPLALRAGFLLEPSVQVDFTENKSGVPVYDYSDFSISGGVTLRL